MIRLSNLSKTYTRDKQTISVLSKVNLTVDEGESVSIMGPSGSGKSTLLNIIAGLDTEVEGDVEVDGQHLQQLASRQRSEYRNRNIGFIFQEFYLLPHLTNLENTIIPLLFSDMALRKARAVGLEALASVGLSEFAQQKPSQLSGGQKQRVVIARALVNRPRIILADEPTANLDHETADSIVELILRIAKQDRVTLIIATHSRELAARAGRIINISELQNNGGAPGPVEPASAKSAAPEGKPASKSSKKMQNVRRMQAVVNSALRRTD